MRHLDLSFEGRRLSDRDQPDNGIRPHGGYRGSKRHPMCHFSYDKGKDFQHKMEDEIERLILSNELALQGTSPSWTLAVHREPSYTDESPLISNQYLAASKAASSNGVNLQNRPSLLPPKKVLKPQKREKTQFYRPNSTHQYLSATELKNASEGDVNPLYGRPTRTTLLRARQRCTSAPLNNQAKRRENEPKTEDFRSCYSVPSNTENLQLDRDGETLHSFLTGARYNRAHCLDSRSVDHTGVYMPRNNTAMGCFFTGPKGHEYLKEFEDTTPRSESMPSPRMPFPASPKRRPTTAPGHGNRGNRPVMITSPVPAPPPPRSRRQEAWALTASGAASPRFRTLNVIGCRLPLGIGKEMALRLPNLQPTSGSRKLVGGMPSMDDTYRGYQPPSTPTGLQQQQQQQLLLQETPPTDRRSRRMESEFVQGEGVDLLPVSNNREDNLDVDHVATPVTSVIFGNNEDNGDERDVEKTMMVNEEVVVEEEEVMEKEAEEEVKEEVERDGGGGVVVADEKDEAAKSEEKVEDEEEVKEEEKKEVVEEIVANDEDVKEEKFGEEIMVEEKEEGEKEEEEMEKVVEEDVKQNEVDDVVTESEQGQEMVEKEIEEEEVVRGEEEEKDTDLVEKKEKEEVLLEEEVEQEVEGEEEKPQKEVRFFITEKDREEGGEVGEEGEGNEREKEEGGADAGTEGEGNDGDGDGDGEKHNDDDNEDENL